jgi:hypothetical protein
VRKLTAFQIERGFEALEIMATGLTSFFAAAKGFGEDSSAA